MERFNQFCPNLKFTQETSKEKVEFLDLTVTFLDLSVTQVCKIFTDLSTEGTDCHLYLHCNSSHPNIKDPLFIVAFRGLFTFAPT